VNGTGLLSIVLLVATACRCEDDPSDEWRFFYEPRHSDFAPDTHPLAVGAKCEIGVNRIGRVSLAHGSSTVDIAFESIDSSDPDTIAAHLLHTPGRFELDARSAGRASITLASSDATRALSLSVEEPRTVELRLAQFGQPAPPAPRYGPGDRITVFAQVRNGTSIPLAACGLRPWRVDPEDALRLSSSITTWGPHPSLFRGVAENVHYVVEKPYAEVRLVPEIAGDALVFATDGPPHVEVRYPPR
jgi:hypothetical protein